MLYTPQQVAEKLGIKCRTVLNLVENNEISYNKVGKRARFTDEHIEEYLRNSEVKAVMENKK